MKLFLKYIKYSFFTVSIISLLTLLTPLELLFRSLFYIGVMIFIGVKFWNLKNVIIKAGVLFISCFIILIFVNSIYVLGAAISFENPYKTNTIEYRMKSFPYSTIEYQMKDLGAFGYDKRNVKVTPVTPVFKWETEIDKSRIDTLEWNKVDEYVNELNFKGC